MKEIERERRGKHYEVTGGQGHVTEEGGVRERNEEFGGGEERKIDMTSKPAG